MKHILLILALATLTACASSHTGGYGYAGNNGASAGVTQPFRWYGRLKKQHSFLQ